MTLLVEVVLPGVSVLERLVSGSRERAEKRLWTTLAAAPTARGSADRGRHLVTGQQHDRTLLAQVQRPFQSGEELQ
ncbi:hypothetical protein ACFRMN_22980 [Streptomyces sp. NPDC056835]|uniref:hypothetical protein n=1 Tax=Streptomyces sp. NPDC056835 TaxID=3345956 RepID=UPI0036B05C8D